MDSEKVIKRDNEYVLHTYNRNPVVLEKGHGLYAEGPEGQKYLDFTSGIGVNSLGYCDLAWAEAVSQQAHKLQHTSNLYYTAPCGDQNHAPSLTCVRLEWWRNQTYINGEI